jgi:uncharacterized protein YqeY
MLSRVKTETIKAMKAQDKLRTSVLRSIKNTADSIAKASTRDVTDNDIMDSLNRGMKQRNQSIVAYEDANRQDLADIEKAELSIYKEFLPEQLSDSEIKDIVDDAVKYTDATTKKDMGKVMARVMISVVKGTVDNKKVSQFVKDVLS